MNRILKTSLLGAAIALALPASLMAKDVTSVGEAREAMARGVARLAADPAFDASLKDHLVKGKATLSDVLRDVHTPASQAGVTDLRNLERQVIALRGLTGELDALVDVRVHGVDAGQPLPAAADFWTATLARDAATGAEQVVAFDTAGAEHRFSVDDAPPVPMLIVESDSAAALRAGINVMNAAMKAKGLQLRPVPELNADRPEDELTLLKRIYLARDGEPNISGAAEVFSIVSGVGPDGKPHLVSRPMEWLQHDKTWYTPGMDLINWSEYAGNYVNVQFFEEDGDTNFQALAEAVTSAAGDLATVIAPGAPPALVVAGVSKIASAIIKAMPTAWFENSKDYLDTFYVIERGGKYGSKEAPLVGAAGNAQMVLEPYIVKNP